MPLASPPRRRAPWSVLLTAVSLVALLAAGLGTAPPARAGEMIVSLFGAGRPGTPADPDRVPVELGVQFRSDSAGQVTGVRFYKSAQNTGVHTGSLWSADGVRLATATFANESASGWQTVRFDRPVRVTPGATYVASYHTDTGAYADDQWYFSNGREARSGPLHATKGVYAYGASAFPTQVWNDSNYWVDVVFEPGSLAPPVGQGPGANVVRQPAPPALLTAPRAPAPPPPAPPAPAPAPSAAPPAPAPTPTPTPTPSA
ncbi:MAG: DUF4082 domain-containing protein, partial [Actinomycetota bacterium]